MSRVVLCCKDKPYPHPFSFANSQINRSPATTPKNSKYWYTCTLTILLKIIKALTKLLELFSFLVRCIALSKNVILPLSFIWNNILSCSSFGNSPSSVECKQSLSFVSSISFFSSIWFSVLLSFIISPIHSSFTLFISFFCLQQQYLLASAFAMSRVVLCCKDKPYPHPFSFANSQINRSPATTPKNSKYWYTCTLTILLKIIKALTKLLELFSFLVRCIALSKNVILPLSFIWNNILSCSSFGNSLMRLSKTIIISLDCCRSESKICLHSSFGQFLDFIINSNDSERLFWNAFITSSSFTTT